MKLPHYFENSDLKTVIDVAYEYNILSISKIFSKLSILNDLLKLNWKNTLRAKILTARYYADKKHLKYGKLTSLLPFNWK